MSPWYVISVILIGFIFMICSISSLQYLQWVNTKNSVGQKTAGKKKHSGITTYYPSLLLVQIQDEPQINEKVYIGACVLTTTSLLRNCNPCINMKDEKTSVKVPANMLLNCSSLGDKHRWSLLSKHFPPMPSANWYAI
jgi:hypothetical protein